MGGGPCSVCSLDGLQRCQLPVQPLLAADWLPHRCPIPPDTWKQGKDLYGVVQGSVTIHGLHLCAGFLGMVGASLMLCRCHTSFKVKLAVVVTVGGTPRLPGLAVAKAQCVL